MLSRRDSYCSQQADAVIIDAMTQQSSVSPISSSTRQLYTAQL